MKNATINFKIGTLYTSARSNDLAQSRGSLEFSSSNSRHVLTHSSMLAQSSSFSKDYFFRDFKTFIAYLHSMWRFFGLLLSCLATLLHYYTYFVPFLSGENKTIIMKVGCPKFWNGSSKSISSTSSSNESMHKLQTFPLSRTKVNIIFNVNPKK